MPCPYCAGTRIEVLGDLGRTRVYRCRQCGSTYQEVKSFFHDDNEDA